MLAVANQIDLPSFLFRSILPPGEPMSEIDTSTSLSASPAPLIPAIASYIPLGRSGLLPALHAAQKIYGWISEPVAAEIARALRVPLAELLQNADREQKLKTDSSV